MLISSKTGRGLKSKASITEHIANYTFLAVLLQWKKYNGTKWRRTFTSIFINVYMEVYIYVLPYLLKPYSVHKKKRKEETYFPRVKQFSVYILAQRL